MTVVWSSLAAGTFGAIAAGSFQGLGFIIPIIG